MSGIRLLALALLTACTTQPSTCEVAAADLAGCTVEQTDAFIAACEQTGGANTSQLTAEDGAAACTTPTDAKADANPALVGACVAAMYGVKWTVSALSPDPQPLSALAKLALRPMYGTLVDTVRISLHAQLPPRIVLAGHRLSARPKAMTFGSTIFMGDEAIDDPTMPDSLLLTTVHELVHAQQSERAGGYYGFAVGSCRDLIATNFDYFKSAFEAAAYAVEHHAEQNLHDGCGQVSCP